MENSEENLIHRTVSASPKIVTAIFNPDGRLERKTHQLWINHEEDRIFLFRDSASVPGSFSKDIYQFSSLRFLTKDKKKYATLPKFPAGAFEYFLFSGIRCSAMVRLDEKYLLELAKSLNLR